MSKDPLEVEEVDEVYFTIEIRRSDVEARFAKTGTPAKARSMELIGKCLANSPVDQIKECVLTTLLTQIRDAGSATIAKKLAERTEQCLEET